LYFYNLPSDCEITIYTLAGDVVKRLQHSQTNDGQNIRWFDQYAAGSNQQFAGGEHAWDLITDNDQAIATGLYLFTVKNSKSGEIKTGKFLIIK
jgi:D-lyxose ketol-isomerase